nr:hypothetical protein [Tanacetum cinerariifolium]
MEAQSFKDLIIQHLESIEQCIVERAHHEQEIHDRLNERKLHIQECMVQKVKASNASLGEKDYSGIVSEKGNDQVEKDDSNVIHDSPDMHDNEIKTDQNAVECDDEQTSKTLGESNSIRGLLPVSKSISKSRQAYNVMTNNINHFRYLVDQAWEKHVHDHFRAPIAHDMEILIKTCLMPLAIKTHNDSFTFVHELKQKMYDDLKYVESLEKEIDELESNKADFSNMYDILLQECVSNDVMCSYLHSLSDLNAHTELPCLYLHKVKECECLAQKLSKQNETISKEVYNELLRRFAKLEKHSISLELALQQCQEQMKNNIFCKEKTSNLFLKEREQYSKLQDLKAQLQDKNIAISELKKLIEKIKIKSLDTNFENNQLRETAFATNQKSTS